TTVGVQGGMPVPPGTSASWMPASSLYWIQKSASSISSAAGNRSRSASVPSGPPLAVRVLMKNPAPTVPAPTAKDFPKKERRLMERLGDLTVSSSFSVCGCSWLLPRSFAVEVVVVFMPVESQRFLSRAVLEKLRACYLLKLGGEGGVTKGEVNLEDPLANASGAAL